MRDALDKYQANTGTCPESLSQLVAGNYIRALPVDPATKSSATWNYTRTGGERGMVCDVKTTSPKWREMAGVTPTGR
jgi:general secretion pathway protein G